MNYEVVCLEEKIVAGIKTSTQNSDPEMPVKIGSLWQRFFAEGIWQTIPNKKNGKTIGLYTNYQNGADGKYDVMVCCEVSNADDIPVGIETVKLPEGKYARFVVQGDTQKAIADFWEKCWSMELDRKFTFDFEEYQESDDMSKATVHVYIALND